MGPYLHLQFKSNNYFYAGSTLSGFAAAVSTLSIDSVDVSLLDVCVGASRPVVVNIAAGRRVVLSHRTVALVSQAVDCALVLTTGNDSLAVRAIAEYDHNVVSGVEIRSGRLPTSPLLSYHIRQPSSTVTQLYVA